MKNKADYFGQKEIRPATDILPDGGTRLGRGNASGRERDGMPLHCGRASVEAQDRGAIEVAADLARIPEGVRAVVLSIPGEYDARRLRSQREIIRDVMLSAADCQTWLTLGELRALTRYGEASISAQLRHLRKAENGGYDVVKRHREGASPERPGTDAASACGSIA